jgi:hypothetical protein
MVLGDDPTESYDMTSKLEDKMVLGTLSDRQAAQRITDATQSPEHQTIYVNNVALQVSPWDFKFDMGKLLEATKEKLSYEVAVTVYMSPQHAKLFAQMVARNVEKYEQQMGEIVLPQELASD